MHYADDASVSAEEDVVSNVEEMYDDVDRMAVKSYSDYYREDADLHFANQPTVTSPSGVEAAIGDFFNSLNDIEHEVEVLGQFNSDGATTAVLEATVHYERADGHEASIPSTTVIDLNNDTIVEKRIYIDLAPLYDEQAAA